MLGMGGGVGHGEQTAVGVAREIKFLEAEFGADGVEVGDLSVHAEGCVGADAHRSSGAALVVEDDPAGVGDARPGVVLQHVDVGETGATVGYDDGGGGACCAEGFVIEINVWSGYGACSGRFWQGNGGGGNEDERGEQFVHGFLTISSVGCLGQLFETGYIQLPQSFAFDVRNGFLQCLQSGP